VFDSGAVCDSRQLDQARLATAAPRSDGDDNGCWSYL